MRGELNRLFGKKQRNLGGGGVKGKCGLYRNISPSFYSRMLNILRFRGMRRLNFTKCSHMLIAVFIVGTTALSACGKGVDTAEWREEVKLSDGSVIVVWRKARAKSGGFPDSKRGADIDGELRYDPEGIYWKGDFGVYSSPMSFDRVDGVFYLVRYAENIPACSTKKSEDYAIHILKWANAQWVEIPQSDAPLGRIRRNLEIDPWGHNPEDDTKGLLRLNGQDDRPYDRYARSARDNRTNPETIQAHYERTAIDPRTKQRASAEELARWNLRLCGYWQKKIPVSTSPEETRRQLEESKKRLNAGKDNNSIQDR